MAASARSPLDPSSLDPLVPFSAPYHPPMTPKTTSAHPTTAPTLITDAAAWAADIRHEIHANPELGYEETRTARLIRATLDEIGIEHVDGLAGGTGTLAHLPATTNPESAPTIALRADIDALPIQEETGKPYASQTPGRMHACGHDGHTANLLATARVLAETPNRPNNVTLLFQPAEEGGAGARRMIEDGALDGSRLGNPVDQIYGLHGWPQLEAGRVATRVGPLLAATDEFSVTIRGKGGHAAYPHECTDPIVVAAHVVTALQTIASRRVAPVDAVVVTVGAIHAGSAHNVIPDTAQLIGTIRSLTDATRKVAEKEFRHITATVAEAFGATAEIHWEVGYPCTKNHPEAVRRFRAIAEPAIGPENVLDRDHPTMGGEDFSFYTEHAPACFFFLGLRPEGYHTYPNLHTPTFDFNDAVLPLGIDLFRRLALQPIP